MKANHQKAELLKGYAIIAVVIFPLLYGQSWLASDASGNKYNVITINSFFVIIFYSFCFIRLLLEERQIKSAIRALIYSSSAAILPYVFFSNISIMYLYTNPNDNELGRKTTILIYLINLTFGLLTTIKAKKEVSKIKIINKEFSIAEKIAMNNPYKSNYWKKNKNPLNLIIPMILSLIPFVFFLKNTQGNLPFNIYLMSILGAPLSMYIFLILVKSIYIYFYIPLYISLKEGKQVIFRDDARRKLP